MRRRRTRRAPSSASPRQEQKERTRQGVLSAARTVVGRRGFSKTTTREIAREANVSVGTVFLHFPNIGALAEALLDEHIGAALALAVRTLPKRGDLVQRLVHVSKKLFDSYQIEPDLSREYLAASLFHRAPAGPAVARLAQFQRWVEDELAAARTRGELSFEVAPNLAFAAFFSLYFGALVAGLRGELRRSSQVALLESSLRTYFRMERP